MVFGFGVVHVLKRGCVVEGERRPLGYVLREEWWRELPGRKQQSLLGAGFVEEVDRLPGPPPRDSFECRVCLRVFKSKQALGGHMRGHRIRKER